MALITGTSGADTLEGGAGADSIQGLAGADTIRWSVGGGADTIDGGADLDQVVLNGSAGAESINLSAVGGHLALVHNGSLALDVDNVETLDIKSSTGADTIQVGDLFSTDVQTLNIDLAGPNGLPDGAADQVSLFFQGGGLASFSSPSGSALSTLNFGPVVNGELLTKTTNVVGLDTADRMTFNLGSGGVQFQLGGYAPTASSTIVNGGDGDDHIGYHAFELSRQGIITINAGRGSDIVHSMTDAVLNGDEGDDTLGGSGTLNGGTGDDSLFNNGLVLPRPGTPFSLAVLNGGADNDTISWYAGAVDSRDTVDGGSGLDTAVYEGLGRGDAFRGPLGDVIRLTGDAGHLATLHGGASVSDVVNVETAEIRALEGADTILIDDLGATQVRTVRVDLSTKWPSGEHLPPHPVTTGIADGEADTVTIAGSALRDQVVVTLVNGAGLTSLDTVAGDLRTTNITALDALDRVNFNLGAGDDTFTVSGGPVPAGIRVDGGIGNDSLSGSAGADALNGDADADTLVGGAGADTVNGGAGVDLVTWNNGDGADKVDGGSEADTVGFSVGAASDSVVLSATGATVAAVMNGVTVEVANVETINLNALDGADIIQVGDLSTTAVRTVNLDMAGANGQPDGQADTVTMVGSSTKDDMQVTFGASGTSATIVNTIGLAAPQVAQVTNITGLSAIDQLVVNLGATGDILRTSGSTAQSRLTASGGDGDDQLTGTLGADTLSGDRGADTLAGSDGADRFIWNVGDGFDIVDGGVGADTLQILGAGTADSVSVSAVGTHALASGGFDMTDVETLAVRTLDGADSVLIGELSATVVRAVDIDLAGASGGADAAVDTVSVVGGNAVDQIVITRSAAGLSIVDTIGGVAVTTTVTSIGANDQIAASGGNADDLLSVVGAATAAAVVLNGGAGNDSLTGSAGAEVLNGDADADTLVGGAGADTLNGGAGVDLITWNNGDGADKVDGGSEADTLVFNLGAGADSAALSANGATGSASINGAVVDFTNVETVNLRALAGSDTVQVGDLSTTTVRTVNIDMAGANNLPDGQVDSVIRTGSSLKDDMLVTFAAGGSSILIVNAVGQGGPVVETTNITGLDAGDQLILNFGATADILRTAGSTAQTRLLANGGDGDDQLTGSAGNDTLNGDVGNDVLSSQIGGNDVLNGGVGDDRLQGAGGNDTLSGDAGNDTVSANGGNDLMSGGIGNDDLSGNSGRDTIDGGGDNDTITSNGGADVITGGDGDDLVLWTFRDTGITVDGGLAADTLRLTGGSGPGGFTFSANAGLLRVSAPATLDVDNVETIDLVAPGTAVPIQIGDLSTTDVRTVLVNLTEIGSSPTSDGDQVTITGAAVRDQVAVNVASAGLTSSSTVNGVTVTTQVQTIGATDEVIFNLGDGDDLISFTGLTSAGLVTVDGGVGNDSIAGGAGADLIFGGAGNDTLSSQGSGKFVFLATQAGQDVINNFDFHSDGGGQVIKLDGFADKSFAALRDNGHLVDDSGNVLVMADATTVIMTLTGVSVFNLSADDFEMLVAGPISLPPGGPIDIF